MSKMFFGSSHSNILDNLSKNEMFKLSEEKKHLLKQNDVSFEECFDADVAFEQLKQKYGL